MARSKLDPNQIFQHAYDDDSESLKMSMVGTEMSVSLDESDGDSAAIRPMSFTASPSIGETISVEKMSKMRIYIKSIGSGDSTVSVQLSPLDSGDFWVTALMMTPAALANGCIMSEPLKDITAKRMRVVMASGSQDLELIVVGQG